MKLHSYGICPYKIINGHFFVLLNKTSKESYNNFFKGKIEENESITECALREFQEETGITVDINDLEDYFFQKSPRKDIGIYLLDWVKYENDDFNFQEKEIYSAAWVHINNIEMSKNQQKIMDDIQLFFKRKEILIKHLVIR